MAAKKISSDRKRSRPVTKQSAVKKNKLLFTLLLIIVIIIIISAIFVINPFKEEEIITDQNDITTESNPIAVFNTTMGTFKIELYQDKLPITAGNFIKLVNDGFYNGMTFYRISDDFMIQAGRYFPDGSEKHSPYGNIENPFNLVHLASTSGATYVARWTSLHVRRLTQSIRKMLQKKGFCFVEVLAPCPEIFGRYNKMRSGLEMMKWFKEASVVNSFSDPAKAEISREKIVVGEFVDMDKLTFERKVHEKISKINEAALME